MGGAASTTTHKSPPDATATSTTRIAPAPTRSTKEGALKSLRAQQGLFVGIDGKAYNLTKFASEHPGGEEILEEVAGAFSENEVHSFSSEWPW